MEAYAFMGVAGIGLWLMSKASPAKPSQTAKAAKSGNNEAYRNSPLQQVQQNKKHPIDLGRPSERPSQVTAYESGHLAHTLAWESSLAGAHVPPAQKAFSELAGTDIEAFTHNNMQPFYSGLGSGSTNQNTNFDSEAVLERHGGTFANYQQKRESAPMFAPQRDMSFVNGAPSMTEEMIRERYQPGRLRNHEFPIAAQMVGPGLASGYTGAPEDVYVKQREYLMPRSIDELRAANNQKVSYDGRIVDGMKSFGERGIHGKVERRRPDSFKSNTVEDFLPTTGAIIKENQKRQADPGVRDTQRQTTSRAEKGNVYKPGVGIKMAAKASGNPFRQSLPSFGLGPADLTAGGRGAAFDHGRSAVRVYTTGREMIEVNARTGSFATAVKALVAPLQDAPRTTKAETLIEAPRAFGNASSKVPHLTIYDPEDTARTTLRQTLTAAATHDKGNVKVATHKGATYHADVSRTTGRQTLDPVQYERHLARTEGGLGYQGKGQDARRTTKETTVGPNDAGLPGTLEGQRGGYTVADARAPVTQREIESREYYGTADNSQGDGYKVFPDYVKDTLRQDPEEYFGGGEFQGAQRPIDHTAADNSRIFCDREILEDARTPVEQGPKVAAGMDIAGHMDVYKQELQMADAGPALTRNVPAFEGGPPPEEASGAGTRVRQSYVEVPRIDDALVSQLQNNEFAKSILDP